MKTIVTTLLLLTSTAFAGGGGSFFYVFANCTNQSGQTLLVNYSDSDPFSLVSEFDVKINGKSHTIYSKFWLYEEPKNTFVITFNSPDLSAVFTSHDSPIDLKAKGHPATLIVNSPLYIDGKFACILN